MRLDSSYLHFITKEELRILVAIEIGMKNHQLVPLALISSIGNLRSGETYRTIQKLLKNKLIVHVGGKCDGYKLTYLGYDYLALHIFLKRGVIKDVICKIGVGKESDIYKCITPDGTPVVLKLTRLGRRSFRTIKRNREYLNGRNSYNWLYLSRLSSTREFTFMQVLHQDGFPTPKPIETNRHAIIMSLIDGDPLCNIKKIGEGCSVRQIFMDSLDLAKKFASRGLIHGDFNEFNLMVNGAGQLTVIDFPQCISSKHINGSDYFNRDIECLYTFFDKMMIKISKEEDDGQVYMHPHDVGFDVTQVSMPQLPDIQVQKRLDQEVHAQGHFKLSEEKQLQEFMHEWNWVREQEIKEARRLGCEDHQCEEDQQDEEDQEYEELALGEESRTEEGLAPIDRPGKEQEENDEDLQELIKELDNLERAQGTPENENESQERKEERKKGEQKEEEEEEEGKEEGESSEQEGEEGEEEGMREEWKGMTAYEIRQKIKEEKKIARQKKKEDMPTKEYIKKALYRKKKVREMIPRGNYGAKKKAMGNAQNIRDGLQMGW